jgi:hypothetical protein
MGDFPGKKESGILMALRDLSGSYVIYPFVTTGHRQRDDDTIIMVGLSQ